ncbi:MAG: hypothetical protein ACKO1U_09025 [Bacteroidota bacterium]
MKSPDLKFFLSIAVVLLCMTYASLEKDVIVRSLAVSTAIISIAIAFRGLSSMGLGRDYE